MSLMLGHGVAESNYISLRRYCSNSACRLEYRLLLMHRYFLYNFWMHNAFREVKVKLMAERNDLLVGIQWLKAYFLPKISIN